MSVKIGKHIIGGENPVYFIADIASNHNGDLSHAKELIHACAESRVNAVKMQNFTAETIVSDTGFQKLNNIKTHQSKWKTSVFESYKAASIPFEWTLELKELTEKLGMDYFTSPYSRELALMVEPYVSAFKLGSGDITWHDQIELMASLKKPLLIATGASTMKEVDMAMNAALKHTREIILMQCNTNYTANKNENKQLTKARFSNIHLKVLETYSNEWPEIPTGLSDHTHGDLTVLGAVGLYGCSAVEKHFTLDSSKIGQDHSFSMMPKEWLSMVNNTEKLRENIKPEDTFEERFKKVENISDQGEYLPLIIGNGQKTLAKNEQNTVIVQRRSIRVNKDLKPGDILREEDLEYLRPCPKDGLPPYLKTNVIGKTIRDSIKKGDHIISNIL